jgi:alkylhydroperoxidase family enzyme
LTAIVPRIDVPPDQDPLVHLWTTKASGLTPSAAAFSGAVYERSTLTLGEFESARLRIAQINDCQLCLGWRSATDVAARAGQEISDGFYDHVGVDPGWDGFTERERLAAEFAERFALAHTEMDDDLWARLHAAFSDDELVELGLCVGAWLAFGRLNRVFDVDGGCRIAGPADAVVDRGQIARNATNGTESGRSA